METMKNVKIINTATKTPKITKVEQIKEENISAIILTHPDDWKYLPETIKQLNSPLVKEIIILNDSTKKEIIVSDADAKKLLLSISHCSIKYYDRPLFDDFAAQRNYAISQAKQDWVFFLDSDETLDESFWEYVTSQKLLYHPNYTVYGFLRKNYIDNIRINASNPDYQFRLHKSNIDWIGKVHEIPAPVRESPNQSDPSNDEILKVCLIQSSIILHYKDSDRQIKQNKFYRQIQKKADGITSPTNKVLFSSVMWTNEGITLHAREEAKQLLKLGYDIQLTSLYESTYGTEFKQMYKVIDTKEDRYITYVNNPPFRDGHNPLDWAHYLHYKNIVGYLAWETDFVPIHWRKFMNDPRVEMILTPSNYCKQSFVKSGILKDIRVLPHGVDTSIYHPIKPDTTNQILPKVREQGKYIFLWSGALFPHPKDRKGLDIAIAAFKKVAETNKEAVLLLKLNTLYCKIQDPKFKLEEEMSKYNIEGHNIIALEKDLSEIDMGALFRSVDCYISPHRSEGFGLNILQAMASGTPTIVTGASGNMDYCSTDNSFLIKTNGMEKAESRPIYNGGSWFKPSIDSLAEHMLTTMTNPTLTKRVVENGLKTAQLMTWQAVGKLMDEYFKEL